MSGLLGLRAAALAAHFPFPAGGDAGAGAQAGLPDSVVMGWRRGAGGSRPSHAVEREKIRGGTTGLNWDAPSWQTSNFPCLVERGQLFLEGLDVSWGSGLLSGGGELCMDNTGSVGRLAGTWASYVLTGMFSRRVASSSLVAL